MIKDLIKDKSAKEKANLKGQEIAKVDFRGEHTSSKYGIKIDIQSIEAIEGGVQVFARAWKGSKQLGFGKDGSVEIERFRIFNPPILVNDPNGDIIRESTDAVTGELSQRKLREDPTEAIRQVIAHNVKIVGKENTKITEGKIGNTTSTFFPNSGTGTAPVDGAIVRESVNETYSTIRDGAGVFADNTGTFSQGLLTGSTTTDQYQRNKRVVSGFDISSIGTDVIDTATFSLHGAPQGFAGGNAYRTGLGDPEVNIVETTPTNNDTTTALVTADYDIAKYGSTEFSSDITLSSWADDYMDYSMNASGITFLSGGTIRYIAALQSWDIDDSFGGTWASSASTDFISHTADRTGTSEDPKLVLEHSEAPAAENALAMCNF